MSEKHKLNFMMCPASRETEHFFSMHHILLYQKHSLFLLFSVFLFVFFFSLFFKLNNFEYMQLDTPCLKYFVSRKFYVDRLK